jgi:hypothetical protein
LRVDAATLSIKTSRTKLAGHPNRVATISMPDEGLLFSKQPRLKRMRGNAMSMGLNDGRSWYSSPRTRGETWHLHRIIFPRRSITGKLLWGLVWRRRDRKRWIYKKVARFHSTAE